MVLQCGARKEMNKRDFNEKILCDMVIKYIK